MSAWVHSFLYVLPYMSQYFRGKLQGLWFGAVIISGFNKNWGKILSCMFSFSLSLVDFEKRTGFKCLMPLILIWKWEAYLSSISFHQTVNPTKSAHKAVSWCAGYWRQQDWQTEDPEHRARRHGELRKQQVALTETFLCFRHKCGYICQNLSYFIFETHKGNAWHSHCYWCISTHGRHH